MRLQVGPPPALRDAAHPPALTYVDRPSSRFWLVWCAGTFGILLLGLAIAGEQGMSGGAGWLIGIGTVALVANCALALATSGYTEGSRAGWGRVIAHLTGWPMIMLAIVVVAVAIVVVYIFVVAVAAALSGDRR